MSLPRYLVKLGPQSRNTNSLTSTLYWLLLRYGDWKWSRFFITLLEKCEKWKKNVMEWHTCERYHWYFPMTLIAEGTRVGGNTGIRPASSSSRIKNRLSMISVNWKSTRSNRRRSSRSWRSKDGIVGGNVYDEKLMIVVCGKLLIKGWPSGSFYHGQQTAWRWIRNNVRKMQSCKQWIGTSFIHSTVHDLS